MRAFFLAIILLTTHTLVLAQPLVATSIKPLQLIAAAIIGEVTAPVLVLDSTQDPHHPALRPSQRRAIGEADIVLWIGPQLETGLERVITEVAAQVLTVLELPEVRLRQVNGQVDPHAWLDTGNAAAIAGALTAALVTADTENAAVYRENLGSFLVQLEGLEADMTEMLSAESFPPFAVYHDGYQYFEQQHGLTHQVSFTSNEEIQPGIRQILAIKARLEEKQVNCIVVDPSINTGFLDNQLERPGLNYVSVEVMGNTIAVTADGYIRYMMTLANGFASCR